MMGTFDNEQFKKRLLRVVGDMVREKDIPTYKVAKLCDIPLSTFSGYLYGTFIPSVGNLCKICKGLKISSDWLLGLNAERGDDNG